MSVNLCVCNRQPVSIIHVNYLEKLYHLIRQRNIHGRLNVAKVVGATSSKNCFLKRIR